MSLGGSWAVCVSEPSREHYARQQITRHTGLECFLPRIRKIFVKHGKKIHRLDPLFPRYLFVSVIHDAWRALLETYGVHGILMAGEKPATLPEKVIDEIKARCDSDGVYVPPAKSRFRRGQKVRVKAGPFSNYIGLYDGMAAHEREAVLLNLLGRMTRVTVREGDLTAAL